MLIEFVLSDKVLNRRIAQKIFGRQLRTTTNDHFLVTGASKKKHRMYAGIMAEKDKPGFLETISKWIDIGKFKKSMRKMKKMGSRATCSAHIPAHRNRYNPMTGKKDSV